MSEVADIIGGGTPSTTRYEFWEGGKIPWITPADLTGYNGREISRGERYITQAGLENSSARLLPARSVLFSSRAPVGYVAIATNPLATSQGFKSFVLSDGILPEYVYFYLLRAKEEITKLASGTTFIEISARACASIPLPIAPSDEQVRIVAKLDALLSRVAAGEAAARRALGQLQRYRAAVLHAGVMGKLTTDWRKTHKPQESGEQLLKRLLQERRARWEKAELKRLQAVSKPLKGDNWKKRYPVPRTFRVAEEVKLPRGWTWASIEQVSMRVTVGHVGPMKTEYVRLGIPFLRSQNIRANRFDPTGLLYVRRSFHEQLVKSKVFPGDVAIVRSGNVGTTCVIPESLGEANCADLVLVQQPLINSHLLSFYMNSAAQKHVTAGKVGVALTHFNTNSVATLAVAVPPEAEQVRIVREVERSLAAADRLKTTLNKQLNRAAATRQSLLREAFVGKLVLQDSNDAPAPILLERIRAAREVEAKKPKAKRMLKAKTIFTRRPLLEVLRQHKTPLTPEQLFREAGFQPKEVDIFYRELASLRKVLREKKPSGTDAGAWPHHARVTLQLKED
jgi:type I restriction enzyme S subunit